MAQNWTLKPNHISNSVPTDINKINNTQSNWVTIRRCFSHPGTIPESSQEPTDHVARLDFESEMSATSSMSSLSPPTVYRPTPSQYLMPELPQCLLNVIMEHHMQHENGSHPSNEAKAQGKAHEEYVQEHLAARRSGRSGQPSPSLRGCPEPQRNLGAAPSPFTRLLARLPS